MAAAHNFMFVAIACKQIDPVNGFPPGKCQRLRSANGTHVKPRPVRACINRPGLLTGVKRLSNCRVPLFISWQHGRGFVGKPVSGCEKELSFPGIMRGSHHGHLCIAASF